MQEEVDLQSNIEEDMIKVKQNIHNYILSYSIFKEIHQLNLPSHKKKCWYTRTHVDGWSQLIWKYSGQNHKIRKALRIPHSTFRRIEFEDHKNEQDELIKRSRYYDKKELEECHKAYIRKLLKPPQFPSAIKEI